MKFSLKRLVQMIALLLIVVLGGSSVGSQISEAASKKTLTIDRMNIHFIVDGKVYHAPKEQQAFIYNGRTYVPLRFASNLFELWVVWDKTNSTVIVDKPTASQLKQLQQVKQQYLAPNADISKPASNGRTEKIAQTTDVTNYKFFGVKTPSPSDAITMNYMGTVYVPLRYFTTQTNSTIAYDGVTKSISMKLDKSQGDSNSGTDTGNGDKPTGNGDQVVDPSKPTRASIVAGTQTKIEELQTSCSTKAYSLYEKYMSASDSEKKGYITQGLAAFSDCESKFGVLLSNMSTELDKHGYESGDEAAKFQKQFDDTKNAMYSKFLN